MNTTPTLENNPNDYSWLSFKEVMMLISWFLVIIILLVIFIWTSRNRSSYNSSSDVINSTSSLSDINSAVIPVSESNPTPLPINSSEPLTNSPSLPVNTSNSTADEMKIVL